jgi:hypothetical protein
MPLKYDLSGTMNTDIKINKITGWIIESKSSQSISGTAYVKDNPKLPGGMSIPMIVNNQIILTEK